MEWKIRQTYFNSDSNSFSSHVSFKTHIELETLFNTPRNFRDSFRFYWFFSLISRTSQNIYSCFYKINLANVQIFIRAVEKGKEEALI
jgi:hypothetical protein